MASAPIDIPVKVKGLSDVDKLVKRMNVLEKEVSQLTKKLPKATNGIEKTGRAAGKASGNVDKLAKGFGALKVAVAALAIGFIAKQLLDITNAAIRSTGEIQKLEAAFTSLTGSSEAAAELRNQLFQLSKTTPFPNEDLQTAARRFLAVGIEVENIEGTINRVGALAAQSGQDLNRLGLIYAQVYAKGRLQGEENLQFLEAGIDLTDELGKVTGLTGEALRDAMSKGQISVGNVNDAIKLATGEMTVLDLAAKAVDVQLDNIGDNVKQVALGFSSALAPAFASVFGVINEAFDLLFPSLESVQELFKPLLDQSKRFAELLEGNPALVDAIAQTFESLLTFGINPAVRGLEDMNNELEENPQGLINLIYDIELAIRQSLLAAKALVQALSAAGKLAVGVATIKVKPGEGFGLISDAVKEAGNLGNTLGAIGNLERLQQRPVQPRTESGDRSGNLQGREEGSGGGGGGGGGGRGASAAADKAAREAQRLQEQLQKQFAASEKLRISADNRLLVAKAISEEDRIQIEGIVKKDEIERAYTERLSESLSAEEAKNLLAAKGLEIELATLKTKEALDNLRDGALLGITEENELLQAKLMGAEREYVLRKQIADLVKAGGGTVTQAEAEAIANKNNALKEQVEILEKQKAVASELAGGISSELTGAFRSIIDGTKSVNEAFADMFQGIADTFLDMAMKILQDAITQQLMGLFTGLLGGGGGATSILGNSIDSFGGGSFGGFFADGGRLGAGKWGIAGEAGPEMISGPANITPMTAGGGGETVVNIVINEGKTSTSSSGSNQSESLRLAKMVESATMQVINREKRPGGSLATR